MTTLAINQLVTYMEAARRLAPDGSLLAIIQSLSQQMEIFGDVHLEECNDGTGHTGITQYYQPAGEFRAFNEGVSLDSSISADFREVTTMLQSRWAMDQDLLKQKARGDGQKAGAIRTGLILETVIGMLKNELTALLYGTRSDSKSPRGIMARNDYNLLSSSYTHDNANGAASATQNKTSLLLIGHGPMKYHWIHPAGDAPASGVIDQPGSPIQGLGVEIIALKDDWVVDADGTKEFLAVRNHMKLHIGHAIEDARYVQRQCNISTSAIDGVDDFGFNEAVLIRMLEAMPDHDNAVMYCNKTLRAQIRNLINVKGNVWHSVTDPFGRVVPGIDNIPLHIIERITNTEDTVV